MPLSFTITREDMLRSKTVEPGWYKVKITKVRQEPAGTDQSTNTWIDAVIQEGPSKDVPLTILFNEKAPGFAVPFLAALGNQVGDNGATVDMERAMGKMILAYVKNDMYQNRLQNKVVDYKPLTAA